MALPRRGTRRQQPQQDVPASPSASSSAAHPISRTTTPRRHPTATAATTRRTPLLRLTAVGLVAATLSAVVVALLGLAGPGLVVGHVPYDLSNFQNEYACDNASTVMVRPRTVADVQAAVQLHKYVMPVGGGWSWNQPFFCASNGSAPPTPNGYRPPAPGQSPPPPPPLTAAAANILMDTLRPQIITVNESEGSVTVDAGVRIIDLIRYLSAYVTPSAPAGWTLPAFPWFVFQTLAGAVATNTHGSSLKHGSLSSQVLSLTMVLANGTLRTFSDETDPFLMRAVRVGVGELGIITQIKFRIVREVPVTRIIHRQSASQFLALLRTAQQQWNTSATLPDWMEETEWFWVPQRHEFLMVSFTRGDTPDAAKRIKVLTEYARGPPEATTAFNSSLQLLERAAAERAGNVSLEDWPLLSNVTFDPTTNLSNAALPYLRHLNETIFTAPWEKGPAAASGPSNGLSAPTTATNGNAAPTAAPTTAPTAILTTAPTTGSTPAPPSIRKLQQAPAATLAPSGAPAVGGESGPLEGLFRARQPMEGGSTAVPGRRRRGGAVQAPLVNASNGVSSGGNLSVAEGMRWDYPQQRPATVFYGLANMADAYIDISRSGVYSIAANTTKESASAYLYQPESILEVNIRKVMYDQYEVAVPVPSMADCWQGLLELLYGKDNLDGDNPAYNGTASPSSLVGRLAAAAANSPNATSLTAPNGRPDYGFRTNPLIRATGAEQGLLSPSGGSPHLWLNIEDYLYYNRPIRRSNVVFKALMGYLRSDPRCGPGGLQAGGARLHWGKAGWPDAGCWHGDREYPGTWCDFGCAVRQLDPTGKFQDSAPDRWTWEGAPLERCCVADQGFKRPSEDPSCLCKVTHKRGAETCPPAPYYTYR